MRRALGLLVLVLIGFGLGLGGLEVALRVAGPQGRAELGPMFDRSPRRLVAHPNRRHPWARGEDDVLRVAVIGDSFTNNFGNQWYDGYGQRLEYLLNLNDGARPAEVRVIAKNATSTWQQRAFLDRALEWGADLVVLGIFLNDAQLPGERGLGGRPDPPTGWRLWALSRSRALAWLDLRYQNARRNWALEDQLKARFSPDDKGFQQFQRAIRYFARKTRRHEVDLVAAIWPNMFGLGPGYPLELAHERIAGVLSETGVPHLDLLDAFRDKSSLRMAVYPGVDSHPSEIAHRIAATAIFEFLLAEGHVDSSYRPTRDRSGTGEGYWLERLRRSRGGFAPATDD